MPLPLIRPPRLKPGDRIGVIATSTPIKLADDAVRRGYSRLAELGLSVEEAPQCRTVTGHTAGTPRERVEAVHDFLMRPDIAGIMAFWGGYQSHQMLEHLDFDLFRRHPKVFLGYSDFSSLTTCIHEATGCVTFSGPAVLSFAKPDLPNYTLEMLRRVVFDGAAPLDLRASNQFSDNKWYEHPDGRMLFEPTPPWRCYRPGKARGRLIAANLGTLLLLAGTPRWPDLDDVIFVVEEDEVETPQTLDRMFTQARQMGVFDRIAGLVIGRLPRCIGLTESDSLEGVLDLALRGYSFPVLTGIDYGHTDPLLTLPIGVQAELDADRCLLTLLEPAVT